MNIRNRFKLLYFIIFLTFFVIGIFTFFSLKRIHHLNEVDKQVHQIYAQSLELRIIEGDYLRWELFNPNYFKTSKSSYIDRFDSIYTTAHNLINTLLSDRFTKRIKVKDDLLSIENQLTDYHQLFIQLEKEKRELGFKDWGIEGEMRKAIHKVEGELKGLNMTSLQVHMLMLRRHEKDYLLRRDLSYRDKFAQEHDAFCSSVVKSGLSKKKQDVLLESLALYKSTFFKLLEKDQFIGESQSHGLLANLHQNISAIILGIDQLSERISDTTQKSINHIILILFFFIVGCATIATVIGRLIFQQIIKIMGGEPEEVALIATNIAKGNLQLKFDAEKDYEGVMKSVVTMTRKLTNIIQNIYTSSDQVVQASQQFSATSMSISQGAFQQAASIDEIVETMGHISQNISNNAANALETEKITQAVKNSIAEIKAQSDLSLETNKTISQKIEMINEITMQTKILALNAAVEAARAGVHGQGFTVIAEEVKRLAENSGLAAVEIIQLTNDSLVESENVSQLIAEIIEPIQKSTKLVHQISEACQEQHAGAQQIVDTIHGLYQLSQENASASEEMASNTVELEEQINSLKDMVAYFNIGDNYTYKGQTIQIKAHKNKKKKKSKKPSNNEQH
jgi:methyl-accepting chemotaxis protein